MIIYKEKQYAAGGVLGAGLQNLGMAGKAAAVAGATGAAGIGQLAATGTALGSGLLAKGAMLMAAHPVAAGALALYGIHRLLKRRRQRRMQERGYSVVERMYSDGSIYEYRERLFSELSVKEQLEMPMDPPKGPRQEVPKKIVRKAKKSGVIQQDSEGNWRIINMNSPQGPVYWKPKYKSKEACERVLRSYHSGGWNKK